MRPLDVGVIGCGTAGAAAALFLARAGHHVTIYERVPRPKAVGAGITLQPTGLHVLARLDLHHHVLARGARLDRIVCETKERRSLIDLSYGALGEGLFGIGLHRGVLFETLFGAVRREPNIVVQPGIEVVDLARAAPNGRERRSWFVDAAGERHGPHELVIAADGARSQLRDDSSTSKRITPYPWGALWFVGIDPSKLNPDGTRDERARTLHQVVDGSRRMLGMLPTGRAPTGLAEPRQPDPRLISLFWSIRCDRVEEWRKAGLPAWKDEVRALAPEVETVLEQIEDPAQLLFAQYHDVVMHRWHTRNVAYLGDAAHATSPQLGQGTNLALWDAMELADALADEKQNLAAALADYSRRREDHLAFYQLATRWLTPFFQGDVEELGKLRDFAMPLMGKVPWMKRMMTLGMLGVVDGFGGKTLTLKLPVVHRVKPLKVPRASQSGEKSEKAEKPARVEASEDAPSA
ncbi:MAG: FAD-dependent monooxygenase [Labilithrix sp.]|nr:FAD-dependent monooxygenase [Labilithrix sp.]MCW5812771.1 FAD-dependent monooxygenase [Labilithrix sp.]